MSNKISLSNTFYYIFLNSSLIRLQFYYTLPRWYIHVKKRIKFMAFRSEERIFQFLQISILNDKIGIAISRHRGNNLWKMKGKQGKIRRSISIWAGRSGSHGLSTGWGYASRDISMHEVGSRVVWNIKQAQDSSSVPARRTVKTVYHGKVVNCIRDTRQMLKSWIPDFLAAFDK